MESVYPFPAGVLWVVTAADRSATVLHFFAGDGPRELT